MSKERKVELATTYTNANNTFTGEHAGEYISAALLSGSTLANEEVTIMPNVRYKQVVGRLEVNDVVKDASCAFSDTSTLTLTERVIEPLEMQVNLELCKKELASGWEALEMGFSAYREMPANFTAYMLGLVGEKVAEEIEQTLWTGQRIQSGNPVSGQFDGLSRRYTDNISSIPAGQKFNVGSPAAVTAANVASRLGAMLDGLPSELYGKNDLRFYVPTNVARAYQRSLGGFAALSGTLAGVQASPEGTTAVNATPNTGYQGLMSVGAKPMNFDGIDLVMAPGMASNTIILTRKSNLYFGTGLLADTQEVRTIDMSDIDGSQNYRVIMRFTAGTQIGILTDSVVDGL